MNKTGGIVAIIAGVFAVIAALVTLLFGGVASVVHADRAGTVIGLGWGGVVFSFLVIVLGALSFSKPRPAGWGLAVSALLGAVLGGTLVAVFMVLAFIGGILVIMGAKKAPQAVAATEAYPPSSLSQKSAKKWPYVIGSAILIVGGLAAAGHYAKTDVPVAEPTPAAPALANSVVDNPAAVAELVHAPVTGPDAVKLTDLGASPPEDEVAAFKRLTSTKEPTSLQRETRAKALNVAMSNTKGKTVVWDLVVNNITAAGQSPAGSAYKISTKCEDLENRVVPDAQIQKSHPKTEVLLTARNDVESKAIQALAGCSVIKVKGVVANYDAKGNVELNPAIIVQAGKYKADDVVISTVQQNTSTMATATAIAEVLAPSAPTSMSEADAKKAALAARSTEPEPAQQDNSASLQAADKELNVVYGHLIGNLPAEKRAELKRFELDWIHNKDTTCGKDVVCLTKFTQERTKVLAAQTRKSFQVAN